MATYVKASALKVGDVIQDRDATGDDHPFVVITVGTNSLHLHNCTSHETSSLTLIKVEKGDKTGDPGWAGKDSFVVKGEESGGLELMKTFVHHYAPGTQLVPEVVHMQVMGPLGPCWAPVQTGQLIPVPVMVPVHSEASYRKIGTIKSPRIEAIVKDIGH